MISRLLITLFICLSTNFAAKRAELHITDVLGFKFGKWEGETTYSYPATNQNITLKFSSTSKKSDDGKYSLTKGTISIQGFEFDYSEKMSLLQDKNGLYQASYQDTKITASYGFKVISKTEMKSIDNDTGESSEYIIEELGDNKIKFTGTRKSKDGTILHTFVGISTYLGE